MDKAIEAAARAAYEMSAAELDESPSWSQISRETRAVYRQMARAAIAAYLRNVEASEVSCAVGWTYMPDSIADAFIAMCATKADELEKDHG